MGVILNLYLKTGIPLFLDGRMMLSIINLTKFLVGGEKVEAVYFFHL